MIRASTDDQRAMAAALSKVTQLAKQAEQAKDTDAVRAELLKVRGAVMDAYALADAIEDNARHQAQRDIELMLEQRVGMELV